MQNVRNTKFTIHRFFILDVLHIFIIYTRYNPDVRVGGVGGGGVFKIYQELGFNIYHSIIRQLEGVQKV